MTIFSVSKSTAWLHTEPKDDGVRRNKDSQLLYGEIFEASETHGAWVYGMCHTDGYMGWVKAENLTQNFNEATHIVDVRGSDLYPEASCKNAPLMPLSFMSRLAMTDEIKNNFQKTAEGLWIHKTHISPIGSAPKLDLADTALLLLGAPYAYGGRSAFGVDCSGLAGLALQRHSKRVRRDSADLIADIGVDVAINGPLQRGDIIHLQGHIGIMLNATDFLNATARYMSTVIENIEDAASAYEGGISRVKRI